MKKLLVTAVAALLLPLLGPVDAARAEGGLAAAVSIPSARYNGVGCVNVPVTLHLSGGVSNGFAYWTTENEALVGPTSWPAPPSFFVENEGAPGVRHIQMCPFADHAGAYTYSADVWFHNWSDEGGDQYVGRVSAQFSLGLAASRIAKIAKHKWQVQIVGAPYLVQSPYVYLQKLKRKKWRTIAKSYANSAGKLALRKRAAGKYRLLYKGNAHAGIDGSTSKVFRRP